MTALANRSTASDHDALVALNAEYIRCVKEADATAFARFLAPDFLCTHADGSQVGRDEFLRQAAQPPKISAIEAHDVQVRLFGDFAIIHARTTYRKPDATLGRGTYTDIYAKRDGRWLAIAAHVTRL